MSSSTLRNDPWRPDEWDLACKAGVNIWLVGESRTTEHFVDLLLPHLTKPVMTLQPDDRFALPSSSQIGTLILFDVVRIALDDQRRLSAWLLKRKHHAQVISTSTAPVLPMIRAGVFLESLYYRLNPVYLDTRRLPLPTRRLPNGYRVN